MKIFSGLSTIDDILGHPTANQPHSGDKPAFAHVNLLTERCLTYALASLRRKEYSKTEEFLQKGLDYANQDIALEDASSAGIVLAYVCAMQNKWTGVANALLPWLRTAKPDDILKLDMLALLYYRQRDFGMAVEYCSEAINCKWRVYGEKHPSLFHSISLLCEIYSTKGDTANFIVWHDFLPPNHKKESTASLWNSVISDALNSALEKITHKCEKNKSGKQQQSRSNREPVLCSDRSQWLIEIEPRKLGPIQLAERLLMTILGPMPETEMLPGLQFESKCGSPATSVMTQNASRVLNHRLKGRSGHIYDVELLPDGRLKLAASSYCSSWLWDTDTGLAVCSLQGYTRNARSLSFSPNGQVVETGTEHDTARLWETGTGGFYDILKSHAATVWSIAFSPDGQLVATSSDCIVRVWDVETGHLRYTVKGHSGAVWSIAFSPDGQCLATGSRDKTAGVWDAETGRLRYMLKGHIGCVWRVAFSRDGRLLATGSHDHTARLWDAKRGYLRCVLGNHTASVQSVAFSPNGRFLATGSHDHTAKMWDAETGRLFDTINGIPNPIQSVDFSQDGQILATGSDEYVPQEWSAGAGKLCCGDW